MQAMAKVTVKLPGLTAAGKCSPWRRRCAASVRLFLARVFILFLIVELIPKEAKTQDHSQQSRNRSPLAELSPADLAEIEVTSASKEPEEVWRTPAAIYVI